MSIVVSIALLLLLLLCIACTTPSTPTTPPAKSNSMLSLMITPWLTSPSQIPTKPATNSADIETLRTLGALQDRLDQVAAPLLLNNFDLCKTLSRNLIGFTAKTKYSYSLRFSDTAQKIFHLDERLKVANILANSGAARAGIRRGDILIAAENILMPQGQNAESEAATMLAPLVTNMHSSIKLTVMRDDAKLTLDIPLTRACGMRIQLGNADHVNSYADGHRLMITRGMINFVNSDEELAYVIAKEMAHNALAHPAEQRMTGTVGNIIDNLAQIHPDMTSLHGIAGIKTTPKELDAQADRLALYMLVRAGYNINHVAQFWQRLAQQYPATILNGHTAIHPATVYRLAVIDKTISEIQEKQRNKKPLIP